MMLKLGLILESCHHYYIIFIFCVWSSDLHKARYSNHIEITYLGRRDAKNFSHIQITSSDTRVKLPIKAVEKLGQSQLNSCGSKGNSRAASSTCPKRNTVPINGYVLQGFSWD